MERPDVAENIDPLALAGVMCARVCHDLAGTLGALAGMLDMQRADGTPDAEALDLARCCAGELTARLRLMRAAWGADSDVPELATLIGGLPGAERLRIDMTEMAPGQDESMRRLTASLLLVAAGALPRGGVIVLAGGTRRLTVGIEGARAAWPSALQTGAWALGLEPRSLPVAMACLQAQALGLTVRAVSAVMLAVA